MCDSGKLVTEKSESKNAPIPQIGVYLFSSKAKLPNGIKPNYLMRIVQCVSLTGQKGVWYTLLV